MAATSVRGRRRGLRLDATDRSRRPMTPLSLATQEWSLYHAARLKTRRAVAKLRLGPYAAGLHDAGEFSLGPDGLLLPAPGRAPGSVLLLSGGAATHANATVAADYVQRLDVCDNLAEHPRIALALGIRGADGHGWCWRQRTRRKERCARNLAAQALCVSMCGVCPPARFGDTAVIPLTDAHHAALRLQTAAIAELPRPTWKSRWLRAWRVLVGSEPAADSTEPDDLTDDWRWWHAAGVPHARGRLHAELRWLLDRSPRFTVEA